MSEETKIVEVDSEYMLSYVPMDKRRPTFGQIMVWVGFGYCATGMFIGGTLAGSGGGVGLNPMDALLAVILGMGSLMLITGFIGMIAQKTGYNLSLICRFSYGSKGMILPMALMGILTFGWFASIVGMVADIWGGVLGNPSGIYVFTPADWGFPNVAPISLEVALACLFWGFMFTVSALRGIRAIEKVATYVCPFILVVAVVCTVGMISQGGGMDNFFAQANQLDGLGIGTGVNLLIGSWIAGAIMGADMFRFNKNTRAVWLGSASCFILTNPLLNFSGYVGTIMVGQANYVVWMVEFSVILAFVGVVAWTTSLWTTDNSELYCNSLYTGPVLDALGMKKVNRNHIVLVCGIVGTILGSLGFYQVFFADFINYLGAVCPPVCAPLLADYYLISKKKYDHALLNKQPAWRYAGVISFLVGAACGFVFSFIYPLPSSVSAGIVSMAISFVVYLVLYRVCADKAADEALLASL